MKSCIHLYVTGMVQGVFFRYTTKNEATRLGLSGWVKNLMDGRVEIMAEGEKKNLEKLLAWSYSGPPGAAVKNVEYTWSEYSEKFTFFYIKY